MPLKAGDKIGQLTLVEPLKGDVVGRGSTKKWRCSCACGRTVVRNARSLYNARRGPYNTVCDACTRERRQRGAQKAREARRVHNREALLRLWNVSHTLYGIPSMVQMETDVMNDLVEEFGPLRNPTLGELDLGDRPATFEEDPPTMPIADSEFYDKAVDPSDYKMGRFEEEEDIRADIERSRQYILDLYGRTPPELTQQAVEEAIERHVAWFGKETRPKNLPAYPRRPPPPRATTPNPCRLRLVREDVVKKLWPVAFHPFICLTDQVQTKVFSALLERDRMAAG